MAKKTIFWIVGIIVVSYLGCVASWTQSKLFCAIPQLIGKLRSRGGYKNK